MSEKQSPLSGVNPAANGAQNDARLNAAPVPVWDPSENTLESIDVKDMPTLDRFQGQAPVPKKIRFQFSKRNAIIVSFVITVGVMILTGATILLVTKNTPNAKNSQADKFNVQDVSLTDADSSKLPPELRGASDSLYVNGDIIAKGVLKVTNGAFVAILKPQTLTANRTYNLPDASGTLCLDSNNCGYATSQQLQAVQARLAQIATPVIPPSVTLNGQVGAIAIQGTDNQISVTTVNGVIKLAAPQDLAPISSPTFAGAVLNGDVSIGGTLKISQNCTTYLNGGLLTTDAAGNVKCVDSGAAASGTPVTTGGGTVGTIPFFSGGSQLSDSIISQSLGTATISGNFAVTGNASISGGLTLASALTVPNGGTGVTSFTSNGVIYGNGVGGLLATSAPVAGQVLVGTGSGAPGFATISGDLALTGAGVATIQPDSIALGVDTTGNYVQSIASGNGINVTGGIVEGATNTINVIYGSTANTSVQGNTQLTVSAGSNLSGGGTITLGAGGTLNVSVVANPTFATSVTSPQFIVTGTGSAGTVQVANLGQPTVYTLPDPGQNSATICLSTGNCTGNQVTSTGGTAGTIPVFSGSRAIVDSIITQITGTTININGSLTLSNALGVAYGGTGATSLTSNGLLYGNGTGAVQATAAPTAGQIAIGNASGVPTFTTLGGDGSLTGTGALTINKLQNNNLNLSGISVGGVIQYNGTDLVSGLITNTNLQAGAFSNITGTGALSSGSIAAGFGTISTGNNISTTAIVQGATVTATGALQGNTLSVGGGSFAVNASGAITAVTGITTTGGYTQSGAGNNTFSGATTFTSTVSQTGAGTFSTGTGAVSLNGNTSVTGTGNFTVGTGATSVGGTFNASGNATFGGNVSQSGATIFSTGTGAVSLNGNTSVTGTNTLTVGTGATTLGGTLGVTGATTLSGTLGVTGLATFNGGVLVTGTNTLTVGTGATTLGGTLAVTGNATFAANITQSGAVTFSTGTGAVSLNGDTTIASGKNFSQTGSGTFGTGTGAVSLNGNTSVTGTNTLTVGTGATTLGGTLGVTGAATLSGGLSVTGTSTLNGAVSITGTNTLTVGTGATTLGGTLGVTGAATFTGPLTVNNTADFNGVTSFNANTAVTGTNTFTVGTGATTLGGTLGVTGATTLAGNATVGTAGSSNGLLNLANNTNTNLVSLQGLAPSGTGNATLQFPTIAGGATDTVCLYTIANCAGAGNSVTANAGAAGYIPVFNAAQNITSSIIFQTGTSIGINTITPGAYALNVQGGDVNFSGQVVVGNGINVTSGASSFAGNVSITGANTFTVGTGTASFGGATTTTGAATFNGAITQSGANTFSSGSGAVSLNGDTTIASGKNFSQTGTGSFSTGTGNVSINGNTSVTGSNTFTVGTGATTLNGTLTASGLASLGGGATITGATTITGGTNINTTGTASTAIGNATGTLSLTSNAFNVTTGGAVSGITTLIASGAITAATTSNTINGLVINSGALSSVTGITTTGGYLQTGVSANTFSGAATFSAAGTGLTVSNNATVTGTATVGTLSAGAGGITTTGVLTVSGAGTSSIAGQLNLTSAGTALNVTGNAIIAGNLSVQSAGGLTLGVAGSVNGRLNLANSTNSNLGLLEASAPSGTGDATYTLPSIAGGASDTVCLYTLNNCAGNPNTVTTSTAGTANTLAKFTGGQTIADSSITDDGTTVTVNAGFVASTISTDLIQSTGALAITPGGNLTIGATNRLLTLQGNASTKLTASASGFTSTLNFVSPTSNTTVSVPNETGTICLQNSANCGFAMAGTGVLSITGTAGGSVAAAGAITFNNALTTSNSVTINDASTTTKGIAQFNSTNFSVAAGVVNTIQDIATTSSVTFGNLALGSGGNVTLSATGSVYANNLVSTGGTNDITIDAAGNQITFKTANGANSFIFPTYGGTGQVICTSGITCATGGGQALVLEPSAVQAVSGNTNAIYVNKSGGTGNLVQLQTGGVDALIIDNTGLTTLKSATVTGTLSANTITPSGALTVGALAQSFTIQGTSSSLITSKYGSYTTSIGFNTGDLGATGNVTYQFLNDSTVAPGTYNVCTTAGNCSGVGGSVTTDNTAVAGQIAKFSSSGNIVGSLITESGNIISVAGNLNVGTAGNAALTLGVASSANGSLVFKNATNANKITLTPTAPATDTNIALPNQSGTVAVAASGPIVLDATTGLISCPTCLTSGGGGTGGVSSITGTTGGSTAINGALTLNNALTTGTSITIDNASTTTKGIAQFNSANFSVAAGVVNTIQDIATSASPTFNNLSLQGTTGLTVGSASNVGQVAFKDGTADGFKSTFSQATLTADRTVTVPNASGTVAVSGSGNIQLSATGDITTKNAVSFSTSVTTPLLTSAGALSISSSGALTIGSGTQSTAIQGNASTSISATSGSFTSILNFTSPTAARTISVPNESGTICLQTSTNCGFALAANVVNSLNGLNGTLSIANASAAGATITIDNASTTTKGIAQFNSTNFSASAGTINTIQDINTGASPAFNGLAIGPGAATFSGSATFNNTTSVSGTNTFSVGTGAASFGGTVTATGLTTLNGGATVSGATSVSGATTINTTGTANTAIGNATGTFALTSSGLNIGTTGAISGATTISASGAITAATSGNTLNGLVVSTGALSAVTGFAQTSGNFLQSGTGTFGTATGAVSLNGDTTIATGKNFTVVNGTTSLTGTLSVTGAATFSSTGVFQGASVTVGAAAQQGSLILNDGATKTGTVRTATLGQNTTYILQDPGAASVNICLSSGNCAGSGTGVTASTPGTAGRIPVFTAGQNIGDSWLAQAASTLTLDNTRNLSLAGGNLSVTGSGSFSTTLGVTGLTTLGGGASVSGGLNNNAGGITNTGAIAGATTINASGLITGSAGASITGGINANGGAITGANSVTSTTSLTLDSTGANAVNIGTNANSKDINIGSANTNQIVLQGGGSTATLTSGNGLKLGTTTTAGALSFTDGTADGFVGKIVVTTLTANRTYTLPNVGGTICTTTASSCSSTYQVAGSYLAKDTADTSTINAVGNLYSFTNSNTGAAGVLTLTNAGTSSALTVTGTGNASAGQAYIRVNNTSGTPSGSLIDLQVGGVSKLSFSASGDFLQSGTGSFATASGAVSLNGATTVTGTNALTVNGGAINANGGSIATTSTSFDIINTAATTVNAFGAATSLNLGASTGTATIGNPTVVVKNTVKTADNAGASSGALALSSGNSAGSGTTSGAVTINSGNGTGTNTSSGNITIAAGTATGTGTVGNVILQGAAGNVAIGNVNPGYKLDVTGDINVRTGGAYRYNGTAGASTTCSGGQYLQNQIIAGGIVTGGTCATVENPLTFNNGLTRTGDTIALGGTLNAATTIATGNTNSLTLSSDLTAGARASAAFTVSQANNATNNSTAALVQFTNNDTATAAEVLNISNAGTGNSIVLSGTTAAIASAAATNLSLISGTTGSITLDSGTTGAVNIGTGNGSKTIQIGNIANAVTQTINLGTNATAGQTSTVNIGSTNANTTTNINGGAGINIATGAVATTVQIGNTSAAVAQTFNIGNSAFAGSSSTVNIGSAIGASAVNINAGSGAFNVTGVANFSSTAVFSGASVKIGANATKGNLILSDGSSNIGTLQTASLGQDTTYILPDPGLASVSLCLSNGNCAGSGFSVTASTNGAAGRLAVFVAGQDITSSWLLQSSSTLTLDSTKNLSLAGGNLSVTGNGSFSGTLSAGATTVTTLSATSGTFSADTAVTGTANFSVGGKVLIGGTGTPTYDVSLNGNAARTLKLEANTNTNTAGASFTIGAGNANGSTVGNSGGNLILSAGNAAGTGNNNGGNVTLDGGTATGTGTKGAVILQGTGGNVGIGATAPDYKLQIDVGSSTNAGIGVTGSGNSGIELRTTAAIGDTFIDFTPGSTSNTGVGAPDFGGRIIYQGASNSFQFGTNGTTKLTVTSTGDLQLAQGNNHSLNVAAATSGTNGYNFSIGAGAAFNGTGGALALTGGSAAGTNQNGGQITLNGGTGTGTGSNGNVVLQNAVTVTGSGSITQRQTTAPVVAGSVTAASLDNARGAAIVGKYAYVTSFNTDTLNVIDISNPASPVVVGSVSDATKLDGARRVKVAGNYAYVAASNSSSLTIIDISNPTAPVIVGTYSSATYMNLVYDVAISGQYAYVTGYTSTSIAVINISNPTAPTLVSGFVDATNLSGVYGIEIVGKYLYATAFNVNRFTVVDISNPSSLTVVGSLLDGTNLNGGTYFTVVGRYAYVAVNNNNRLTIVDIKNPASPIVAGSIQDNTNLNGINAVKVGGDYAYVASYFNNSVSTIDISNPTTPTIVATTVDATNLSGAIGIEISGKYVYAVAAVSDRLTVIDSFGLKATSAQFGGLEVGQITINQSATIQQSVSVGTSLTVGRGGIVSQGAVAVNGRATFKNQNDSVSAFDIQNASGSSLFKVDTLTSQILLGANVNPSIAAGAASSFTSTTFSTSGSYADYNNTVRIGADGFPRMTTYKYDTTGHLFYTRCLSLACDASNRNVTEVTGGGMPVADIGNFADMRLASDGFARIAHYNYAGSLLYTQCTNADCSTSVTTVVDAATTAGEFPSLALDASGFARITYYDNNGSGSLKYVQCTNAACTTKAAAVTISTSGYPLSQHAPAQALTLGSDGFARIVYRDETTKDVKYARCVNVTCASGVVTTSLDLHTALGLAGTVDIGYLSEVQLDASGFALFPVTIDFTQMAYVKCTATDCTTKSANIIDTDASGVGEASFAIASDGFPRIAIYHGGPHNTRYIVCTTADCTSNTNNAMTLGDESFPSLALTASNYVVAAVTNIATYDNKLIEGNGTVSTGISLGATDKRFALIAVVQAEVSSLLNIGDGTNGVSFDGSTGVSYKGSARKTKTLSFKPEFEGATLVGDGSANVGYMTSAFCSNVGSLAVNTGVCAAGQTHSYYEWTTAETTAQDYDVYLHIKLPSDYDGSDTFANQVTLTTNAWRTNTTINSVQVSLYSQAGTQCGTSAEIAGNAATWKSTAFTSISCTAAANDYLTLKFHMTANTSNIVRLGEVELTYKSVF